MDADTSAGCSEDPVEEGTLDPGRPHLGPENAVLLPTSDVPGYLYRELSKLGLVRGPRPTADIRTPAPAPTSSRTLHPESDDSRYWLADLNAHQNIALRFVPQKEYARAAPLETEPAADVVTRVFMLFRGVSTAEANDEMHWASVQQEVNWASVVGIDPRIGDANLLRVLEWGGMEVV